MAHRFWIWVGIERPRRRALASLVVFANMVGDLPEHTFNAQLMAVCNAVLFTASLAALVVVLKRRAALATGLQVGVRGAVVAFADDVVVTLDRFYVLLKMHDPWLRRLFHLALAYCVASSIIFVYLDALLTPSRQLHDIESGLFIVAYIGLFGAREVLAPEPFRQRIGGCGMLLIAGGLTVMTVSDSAAHDHVSPMATLSVTLLALGVALCVVEHKRNRRRMHTTEARD